MSPFSEGQLILSMAASFPLASGSRSPLLLQQLLKEILPGLWPTFRSAFVWRSGSWPRNRSVASVVLPNSAHRNATLEGGVVGEETELLLGQVRVCEVPGAHMRTTT